MPSAITPDEARRMLRSREDLLDAGLSERRIRAQVAGGELHRVRRGWYVPTPVRQELWPEGRHLVHILAVDRDAPNGIIAAGVSAAVLWDLPLYRLRPRRIHVISTARSRSVPDVMRHAVAADDITERHGIRCTPLARTVLDLSCQLPIEAALSCADAALRSIAVTGQVQDEGLAAAWREELGALAMDSHVPGIRRARRVIAFSDGRAQLPGESVSRLQLRRLGFQRITLQVPVPRPGRRPYWVDFGLDDVAALGEFDGEGKYVDPELRGDRSLEQTLLAEKQREDWIRGVTQRPFARWGHEHITTHERLGARLAAFRIPPPGR